MAPAREVSIVFGVLLGANALGESRGLERSAAAIIILGGIALLTLA